MIEPKPKSPKPSPLNQKEAEAIRVFLNRVKLDGSESDAHSFLKSRLIQIRDYTPEPADIHELNGSKGHGAT